MRPYQTRLPSARAFAMVASTAAILILPSCNENHEEQARRRLDSMLTNPAQQRTDEIVDVCRVLGTEAFDRVEAALARSEKSEARSRLMETLIELDVKHALVHVIRAVARSPNDILELRRILLRRLDEESRRILQGMIETNSGEELITALKTLELVCDDVDSLRLLKRTLSERSLSKKERMWVINALGWAAYYNNDETTVDFLRPYLLDADNNLRMMAMIALGRIPGEEVEGLVRDAASKTAGLSKEFLSDLLEARRNELAKLDRKAPGMRSE